MRVAKTVAAVAATSGALVSAVPLSRQSSLSPCANVTQSFEKAVAANVSEIFVDGQVAYDCLNSMSFDPVLGSAFVLEMRKYLQFQSTIPVLKNPPSTYLSRPVDLLGGLDTIFQKANTSQYQSQYQMDSDLNALLLSANDGHLNAAFCSLGIFAFSQETQLVSISTDGVSLPKLYTTGDAVLMANGTNNVSEVVSINGEAAVQYLEKLGSMTQNQDPDAQYNNVFPSQAKVVAAVSSAQGVFLSNNGMWPGSSNISLTFANGSTYTSSVYARILPPRFNFTDGESLFTAACIPKNTTSTSSSSNSTSPSTTSSVEPTMTAPPTGYPTPVIRDPYNIMAGYYLDAPNNDTAVLFVPTFETFGPPLPDWSEEVVSDIASQFVNQSLADGKTKMIIDISGNPGGTIYSGFNLFKLFFPDMQPYTATRMRDHDSERLFWEVFASADNETVQNDLDGSVFLYETAVGPYQNSTFATWEDLYGPADINGANMTNLFANFNFTTTSNTENPIRGYGGVPLNESSRPFEVDNLLVISDGFCQSTCTTFVNLMTNQGGVKSLAFGGRPDNKPMQIMGGVRGAQSQEWHYLYQYGQIAYQIAVNSSNSSTPALTPDQLDLLTEVSPVPFDELPLYFGGGNLNLRNAYNPDDSEIPLQFQYQAANCKLFYTYENLANPGSQWVSAAQAYWGNGTCVSGSESNFTMTR